jgi:hypothetical protein
MGGFMKKISILVSILAVLFTTTVTAQTCYVDGDQDAVMDNDPGAYPDRPDCDHETQYIPQGTNTCQEK